jgi:CBS domain-containing protein
MTEHAEIEIVRHFDPVTLPPDATVMMAARHMRSQHITAVLVTEEDGKLIGIFTERDAISRVLAEGKDPVVTTLAEVMTDNPDTVSPADATAEVVRAMRAAHCRHLPMVEDGKVVGIVSRGQLSAGTNPMPAMPDPNWIGFASPVNSSAA